MTNIIRDTLKNTFGFNRFRPHQEEIVGRILEGKDVFVVMPTGGGKSLCFQLPAKIMPGVTVVISPLISLMRDQVDGARENNISAMYLNSSLAAYERAEVYRYLRNGQLDMLYISPERLANEGFYQTLRQLNVSLFAVDEAHCISEWGHDFRPDYMNLSRLVHDFPGVPMAAFTATATMKVQQDIIKRVGLRSPLLIRASFDRPNLYYHITRKTDANAQVLDYIRKHPGKPGIIYRTTRKAVSELYEYLIRQGIKALPYHAGLSLDERDRHQDAFNKDEVDVICATIAFGMGIDKSNARFVIHGDLPKNMEGYYQETGRAGRDGDHAECLLLFSPKDIPKIRFFIEKITDPNEKKIAETKLYDMIGYASHNVCRRKSLLAYFGETYGEDNCGNCDICNGEHEEVEISRDAQIIMSAMMRTDQRFGIRHIIDIVTGSKTKRIRQYRHEVLKTYGAGKDKSKKHWSFIMDELLSQEAIIQTNDQYPTIRISASGKEILFGRQKIHALVQPEKVDESVSKVARSMQPCDEVLFEKLRALRHTLAREQKVPPYIIFSDKTLREMANYLPKSPGEMLGITGVGEMKLEKYGDLFIKEILAYGNEKDGVAASPGGSGLKEAPLKQTYEMIQQGRSIQDIACERNLSPAVIAGHVDELLSDGYNMDLANQIVGNKKDMIEQAFLKQKTWQLSPVVEAIEEEVTYEEAMLVRAMMKSEGVEVCGE